MKLINIFIITLLVIGMWGGLNPIQASSGNNLDNLEVSTYITNTENMLVRTSHIDTDGTVLIGGEIGADAFVKRLNSDLTAELGSITIASGANELKSIYDLDVSSNGLIYAVGSRKNLTNNNIDGLIIQLDALLSSTSEAYVSTSSHDELNAIDYPFIAGSKSGNIFVGLLGPDSSFGNLFGEFTGNSGVLQDIVIGDSGDIFAVGEHSLKGILYKLKFDFFTGFSIINSTNISGATSTPIINETFNSIGYDDLFNKIYVVGDYSSSNSPQKTIYMKYHGVSLAMDDSGEISGGSNDVFGESIEFADSNIYIGGKVSGSSSFIIDGYDTNYNGGSSDAYVLKLGLDTSGNFLTSAEGSTYLGGSVHDNLEDISITNSDELLAVGYTHSANFPTTSGVINSSKVASIAGFVSIFSEINDPCVPPEMGDWILEQNCVIDSDIEVNGNVLISNNSTLTLKSAGEIKLDLTQHNIKVNQGSTLEIESGGELTDL